MELSSSPGAAANGAGLSFARRGRLFVSSVFLDEFLKSGMMGEPIFDTLRMEFSEPDGRLYRALGETSALGLQHFFKLLKGLVIGTSLVPECLYCAPAFRLHGRTAGATGVSDSLCGLMPPELSHFRKSPI